MKFIDTIVFVYAADSKNPAHVNGGNAMALSTNCFALLLEVLNG